ncbi:MAG: hypothetical protein ABR508_07755 [Candidatus Baltobacteraceae bacterium]
MNVAISGDRSSALSEELAPGTHVVALARGFGHIEGIAVAPAVLGRLRVELARRLRGERLARAKRRINGIMPLLTAAFGRVNADVHARSASNDDHVTAGCSLTGALLVGNCVYLAHTGSTAAYLCRDGCVVSLTRNDAIETPAGAVLTRSIGCAPSLQLAVSSFSLNEGDALVLARRRYTAAEEHMRQWEREASLVVRYAAGPPGVPGIRYGGHLKRITFGTVATVLFYTLLCLR